ncbi:MAG: EamA family transporter [Mogibacterium sp.]|nr:EamA family transporter [Mogibacterium sp.]
MLAYIWPLALVVFSNTMYQICAKSVPSAMHPMASLTVTYFVSTVMCLIMYLAMSKGGNLLKEYGKLNWAPFVFGVVLVGLEVGFIYAYKAGWQVSTFSIMQSAFLAVTLLLVGVLLYHEIISWNKLVGVVFCLVGLAFINYR